MVASCGTGTNIVNFRIFKIRMAKMMRNMVIHIYINFRYMVGAQPTRTANQDGQPGPPARMASS